MDEILLELFVAIVQEDDVEAKRIMNMILYEYKTLVWLCELKDKRLLENIDLCCKEITRLERENKLLKNELECIKNEI